MATSKDDAKAPGPAVTFAGSRPRIDGITAIADYLLGDEGPEMVPIVGLLSRKKRIRDDDRDYDYCVVAYRHIEVADEVEDIKLLTECLGRIYARRMARSGVKQAQLMLPMEPGHRYDPESNYGPGAEEENADAEASG